MILATSTKISLKNNVAILAAFEIERGAPNIISGAHACHHFNSNMGKCRGNIAVSYVASTSVTRR